MASIAPGSRPRRTLLSALIVALVALPLSGAATSGSVPAPVPTPHAALRSATPHALDARYAATRADVRAAERMASRHGDGKRAATLRDMASPDRHFLSFDGRDGGRTAEVFGDLAHAERVAVLVPGSDTSLDKYRRFQRGGIALRRAMGPRTAAISWLGYKTPSTFGTAALTTDRADAAVPRLRDFIGKLSAARPSAKLSVLCHSYGSVVCARAAKGLDVTDIALYGSPGTSYGSAADLGTRATVWAGRGSGDWIAKVPNRQLDLPFAHVGFGRDPVSKAFGARVFEAGDVDHSGYLAPGSPALGSLARIASGRAAPGTHQEGSSA